MTDENTYIEKHPVLDELRDKVKESRKVLLELLEEWQQLQNREKDHLNMQYNNLFGDLESEIQNKVLILSELERRVELLTVKIQRGEKIGESALIFINRVVEKEFEKYKKAPQDKIVHDATTIPEKNGISNEVQESSDMPVIYRDLVKKLHPDKNTDPELFNRYWNNVQDAYKKGNMQRLRLFHKTLGIGRDKEYSDPYSEELALRSELRDLEINFEAEKRRIARLKSQKPFIYKESLKDRNWIDSHRKNLQCRIEQTDREIEYFRDTLKKIGASIETGESGLNDEEFQQKFWEEAYIKRG